MWYGYARVSTREQNEDRQVIALQERGIREQDIFTDKQSGRDFNRQNYQKLMKRLRPGDILFVKSIDRLGRDYGEVMEQWRRITQMKKADIVVLDIPLLDTTQNKDLLGTFISELVLQILSFVAENERKNIKQRQAEGIAAAKARGVKFGRPKKYRVEQYEDLLERVMKGELSRREALRQTKISATTYGRLMREYKSGKDRETGL